MTAPSTRSAPAWRRTLAVLLSALMPLLSLPLPAHAQVRLPALGESANDDMSVGNERRIGDQIMREVRRDPEYLDDPVLTEYLRSIWTPLVAAARQQGNIEPDMDQQFAWEPFLVLDRSVNAFAWPGGFVGVHLGMIAVSSTPDQLASVLAHELSHVTQRHIARSIAPQAHASMLAIATMLLGVLAATRSGNADVANAAIMGGQGAAIQAQLNFSRDVEREADRMGYALLAPAGFSQAGMAAMFEKLDVASRLNDNGGFPYLRSHPLTTDRISEARNRSLLSPSSAPSLPNMQHTLMQMRARVLMADGATALQRFNGGSASPVLGDRVGVLYAAAFAASLLNDHARAERQATQALELAATASPRNPAAERTVQLLQAQVRLARHDDAGALQALDSLPAGYGQRPPLLLRAQALLDQRRRDPASPDAGLRGSVEALQTWVAEQPQDPLAWDMLASTSDALGLRLRSMRAAAEARYVLGDLQGAIDRLRSAQSSTRTAGGQDFIEASVIDSRLRRFTALRRQLVLEARGETRSRGDEPPPPQLAP